MPKSLFSMVAIRVLMVSAIYPVVIPIDSK